ncbi:MAG: YezD family protein [Sporomusaceae bacterium]|nr:YezD family protein [Sporomusaceae bacterium]
MKEVKPKVRNEKLREKICEAVASMQFGQIVIVVKAGKVVQVERTEKQRYASWENLYGDGI